MIHDLVLVGAGLANGLIALRLLDTRPDLSLVVLEGATRPGGNHTWSCHASDLSGAELRWLDPAIGHRWPAYDVVFPGLRRRVSSPYLSVTSDRFAELLAERLGPRLRLASPVRSLSPTSVLLESGETVQAKAIIDGRGPSGSRHIRLGYQKFVGQEIVLSEPHGLACPILMDADVPQRDGYRFVYVLPLAPDRLLVEDTYYADAPTLDADLLRARIAEYLDRRGWRLREIAREELGVLPIALGGDIERFWDADDPDVPRSGLRAALFHPTTGYSLPDAVHFAWHLAAQNDLSAAPLYQTTRAYSARHWRRTAFFRRLNRMLFGAGRPENRWEVLRRFNRLPASLIGRFYAGRLSIFDKLRLVAGKPPVPLFEALPLVFADGASRT